MANGYAIANDRAAFFVSAMNNTAILNVRFVTNLMASHRREGWH